MKYKRPPLCICGHSFDYHHGNCIMRREFELYPLNFGGLLGGECEFSEVNGINTKPIEERCYCGNYTPRSLKIQIAAQEFMNQYHRKQDAKEEC